MDIICKENDNHAKIHRAREVKQQCGLKSRYMDLPEKGTLKVFHKFVELGTSGNRNRKDQIGNDYQ